MKIVREYVSEGNAKYEFFWWIWEYFKGFNHKQIEDDYKEKERNAQKNFASPNKIDSLLTYRAVEIENV